MHFTLFTMFCRNRNTEQQRLTFQFQNFSVSRLLPIFWVFQFRFQKIWSRKKSPSFGFGKFGLDKKVSFSGKKSWFRFLRIWSWKKVSVSENLVLDKKSRFWFWKTWSRKRKNQNNKKGSKPKKQCKSLVWIYITTKECCVLLFLDVVHRTCEERWMKL